MRKNLRFCYNFAPKVEHFLVNCFRKDSTFGAGRLYDKIGNTATAKVKYVLANAVVCKVKVPLGAEPAEDGEEDISF